MPEALPKVSVLLPVRNEGRAFGHTLEAITGQDYPAALMEILVIDGMSEDETREVVREFAARDPRFHLLDNPGRIVPCAMNVGILAATGQIIVRVDGHTRIAPDYVRRCVAALHESGSQCVGGRMDPQGDSAVGRAVAAATSGAFGVGNSHFHYSRHPRLAETVYLGTWPRDVLLRIRGFDEEMVRDQDDELNYRLRKLGGSVWLDPSIRSSYTPRGSVKKLWSQYYQYGLWKVRVFQKHPSMLRARHFAPSLFVLTGAGCALWAAFSARGRWAFAAGVVIYLAAAVAATLRSSTRGSDRLLMPVVFFCLHAGYGWGFLAGLAKFAGRWGEPSVVRSPIGAER